MNILQALNDPAVFKQHVRDPSAWSAWRAFLAALFALPMSNDEFERYEVCTGRENVPSQPATEAWLICGRRAGKSFVLSLVAIFLAVFCDWRPYLGPGERGSLRLTA